jgi:hypothetical protein
MIAFLVISCIISVVIMIVCAVYATAHFDRKFHWYDKVGLISSTYMLISGIILLFLLLTTSLEDLYK